MLNLTNLFPYVSKLILETQELTSSVELFVFDYFWKSVNSRDLYNFLILTRVIISSFFLKASHSLTALNEQ